MIPTRRIDGWWCNPLEGVMEPAGGGGGGGGARELGGLASPPDDGDEGIPKVEKLEI